MPLKWFDRSHRFLTRDLWRFHIGQLSLARAAGVRLLRVMVLSLRGFRDNNYHLRASALTFFSILSVVPVAALALGIARGFGLDAQLDIRLQEALQGHEEVYRRIKDFSESLLANTRGGLIAGAGVILLFWTVVKLLGHIEHSFNHIWGIKVNRSLGRKLSDYSLVMFLAPVLFIVSSSFNVFATREITDFISQNESAGHFGGMFLGALKLLPYCVIWVLFTFFYIFMPNTRVRWTAGLVAGVVAGTIYQMLQWVYINFQIGVTNYNAIYGSFAALPLFLIWVQLSWLVVLFGAGIAFSWQNADTFEFELDCLEASPRFKSLVALRATHLIAKNLLQEKKPLSSAEISHALEIPIRLANEVLYELVGAGVLCETRSDGTEEPSYQLARDLDRLTTSYVLKALATRGASGIPLAQTPEIQTISSCLDELSRAMESSPGNLPLKDI